MIELRGAAQVLRLPDEPYLRHDRAGELSLEPGDLAVDARADAAIDASGCAVLPGFVDCHTHLPFAGWRAEE